MHGLNKGLLRVVVLCGKLENAIDKDSNIIKATRFDVVYSVWSFLFIQQLQVNADYH